MRLTTSTRTSTNRPEIREGANVWAGLIAGLVAGAAYLTAQMCFAATVYGGGGWEPLQRISAMLLGDDVVPPPSEISLTIAGIGLLIHLPLSAIYGRVIAAFVRFQSTAVAALRGGALGLLIFAVNFWLVAPIAFPWFVESRNALTAIDHALFGAVAAVCYVRLHSYFSRDA